MQSPFDEVNWTAEAGRGEFGELTIELEATCRRGYYKGWEVGREVEIRWLDSEVRNREHRNVTVPRSLLKLSMRYSNGLTLALRSVSSDQV